MKTFKRAIFVPLLFLAAIAASLAVFAQPAQSQTFDVLASDVAADSPQDEAALAASGAEESDSGGSSFLQVWVYIFGGIVVLWCLFIVVFLLGEIKRSWF